MARRDFGRSRVNSQLIIEYLAKGKIMTTALRQSDGNLPLEKTEAKIATFESGFAKFLNSELMTVVSKKTNRITFEELDLEQPKQFKLTRSTAASPVGFSKIWQGAMFVDGTNTDVIAWRKD